MLLNSIGVPIPILVDVVMLATSAWAASGRLNLCAAFAALAVGGVMTDRDELVRRLAADALGQIGDKRAVELLIHALRDTDGIGPFRRVCDYAAYALERIGTPEARAAVRAWRAKQQGG